MITNADNVFSWNFRALLQKLGICNFVNLPDCFPYCLYQHTTGSKVFHAFR